MVELIVQFYEVNYENASREKIRQRQNEITHCFKQNIKNPQISKVHFLYEKKSDVDFMSNTLKLSYPDGMDVSIFTLKKLKYAFDKAKTKIEKENINL